MRNGILRYALTGIFLVAPLSCQKQITEDRDFWIRYGAAQQKLEDAEAGGIADPESRNFYRKILTDIKSGEIGKEREELLHFVDSGLTHWRTLEESHRFLGDIETMSRNMDRFKEQVSQFSTAFSGRPTSQPTSQPYSAD